MQKGDYAYSRRECQVKSLLLQGLEEKKKKKKKRHTHKKIQLLGKTTNSCSFEVLFTILP